MEQPITPPPVAFATSPAAVTFESHEKSASLDEEVRISQTQHLSKSDRGGLAMMMRAPSFRTNLILSYTAVGVIYGDLGTSPLYVFNAIFDPNGDVPNERNVIGALSCILWSITLLPLIKYCFIALEFGNFAGEGGPFSVFISLYPPKEEDEFNRTLTQYPTTTPGSPDTNSFWNRAWVKRSLFIWVLFGTCATISDGLLTPAVSVVSAVQGLSLPVPSIPILPISIAILLILFIGQGFGTARIGGVFAPIIIIWLLLIGVGGIINIAKFPSVFKAFSPWAAINWFASGDAQFDSLSGVLLAVTGVEAMFANLGAFNKNSIRLSFACLVYPCLILAYLGQGAALITDGVNVLPNVFFSSIPGGTGSPFWWVNFVFGILAAVIASQALISGSYALVQQLARLHAIPPFKIISTSNSVRGQIYCPAVNYMLMLGSIGLVLGFGTGAGLTAAYGLSVAITMIITTGILSVGIVRIKRKPAVVAIAFLIIAGFVDACFAGSSLRKVPLGAWFPLSLALLLMIILGFWSWARGLEDVFDATHRSRLSDLFSQVEEDQNDDEKAYNDQTGEGNGSASTSVNDKGDNNQMRKRGSTPGPPAYDRALQLVGSDIVSPRLPVFAIFHNAGGNTSSGVPHSFSAFLKCWPSIPTVMVFLSVLVVGDAHVNEEDRYLVTRTSSFEGIYIVKLRLGYRDPADLTTLAPALRNRIANIEGATGGEEAIKRMKIVDLAIKNSITHVLPQIHPSASPSVSGNKYFHAVRVFLIEGLYRRFRVNFDEFDHFIFNEEEVLRMSISAKL